MTRRFEAGLGPIAILAPFPAWPTPMGPVCAACGAAERCAPLPDPSDPPIQTVVVNGLELAQELRGQLADEVARHVAGGTRPPCLAVVLVGDDPASASYIKGKRRACQRAARSQSAD